MIDLDRVHPAEVRRLRRRRDLAFACFLFLGASFSAAFIWNRIPTGWMLYRAGAAVLSHPLVMVGLVAAGLVGVAVAATARKEPALRLLAVLTLAVPPVLLLIPRSATVRSLVAGPFFTLLTVVSVLLPMAWFLRWRRAWRG